MENMCRNTDYSSYFCATDCYNMKTQPTIYDIARELHISPSTVSRALANHPRISPATRARVLELATQLGFQPNSMASGLRQGRVKSVGVIVPRINRHFFSSVIGGIEGVASQNGYSVMICQSRDLAELERNLVDNLLAARVSGIIVSLAMETTTFGHLEKIRKQHVPLVFVDRVCESINTHKVVVDDYAGALKATEHLIKCGYRRIAHYGGAISLNVYRNRLRGYLDALKNYMIPADEELIVHFGLTQDEGYEVTRRLWSHTCPPDAIFSASDFPAVGAIQYLNREKGLQIPQDVGIAGFANEPFTALITPALTSVEQHPDEMGQVAARLLFEEIEAGHPATIFRTTLLSPELIVRQSSKKE